MSFKSCSKIVGKINTNKGQSHEYVVVVVVVVKLVILRWSSKTLGYKNNNNILNHSNSNDNMHAKAISKSQKKRGIQ